MRRRLIEQERIDPSIPPRLDVIVPRDAVAIVRFGSARPVARLDLSGASSALLGGVFGPLAVLRVALQRQCSGEGDARFVIAGYGVDVGGGAMRQSTGRGHIAIIISAMAATAQFDNVRVHSVRQGDVSRSTRRFGDRQENGRNEEERGEEEDGACAGEAAVVGGAGGVVRSPSAVGGHGVHGSRHGCVLVDVCVYETRTQGDPQPCMCVSCAMISLKRHVEFRRVNQSECPLMSLAPLGLRRIFLYSPKNKNFPQSYPQNRPRAFNHELITRPPSSQ